MFRERILHLGLFQIDAELVVCDPALRTKNVWALEMYLGCDPCATDLGESLPTLFWGVTSQCCEAALGNEID